MPPSTFDERFPALRTHEENSADIRLIQSNPDTDEARDAFGRVMESYRRKLYGVALAKTKDPNKAEDLAQDVTIHAMRKIHQLREPRALPGWLGRIAHRMAINQSQRGDKAFVGMDAESLGAEQAIEQDPSDALAATEREEALHEGLAALKPIDRETLEAFYLRGRSIKQMAREFNTKIGTIKRRLHVARHRLKDVLGEQTSLFDPDVALEGDSDEAEGLAA